MSSSIQKLSEGWCDSLMGDISQVIGGGTPKSEACDNFNETKGFPWITPADLSNYKDIYIKHGRRFLTEKGLNSCSARLMPAGTILMSSRAPIGYLAIAANEICTSQGFKSFVCYKELNSEYIYYWLLFNRHEIQQMGSGSTFAEISGSRAKQIPLVIAPLDEQKRIADVIERLFTRVNEAKQRLDNAVEKMKRFRKSVLNAATQGSLMGDVSESRKNIYLQEAILSLKNGFSKRHSKKGDSTIVIRLADIANQKLSLGNPRRIRMTNKEKSKYSLQRGDILIYRVNGSANLVGRFILVREDLDHAYCDHFIRMKIDTSKLLPEYLNVVSNSRDIREYISNNTVSTAGQNTVNQKTIGFIKIEAPTIDEQRKVVSCVESLFAFADKIEGRIANARDHVEKLTQSILAKAFKGELVPTEAELARIEGRDYETAKELLGHIANAKMAEANNKEKKQMKRQLSAKHIKQSARRPLMDVIYENPKGITPENLLRVANYTIEEIDDFYCDLSNIMQEIEEIKPSGNQAKKWPTNKKVLIKPKKV